MTDKDFKVGDRVKVIDGEKFSNSRLKNKYGVIRTFSKSTGNPGVEFDDFDDGHDLNGVLPEDSNRGWYVPEAGLTYGYKAGDRVRYCLDEDYRCDGGKYIIKKGDLGTVVRTEENSNPERVLLFVDFDKYPNTREFGAYAFRFTYLSSEPANIGGYKIGDIVAYNYCEDTYVGKVVALNPEENAFGVDFFADFNGHKLGGHLKTDTGWWLVNGDYNNKDIIRRLEPDTLKGFQVGDRVERVNKKDYVPVGSTGTILKLEDDDRIKVALVLWDKWVGCEKGCDDSVLPKSFNTTRVTYNFIENLKVIKRAETPAEDTGQTVQTIKAFILADIPLKFRYVARDKDGKMFAYTTKPKREISQWYGGNCKLLTSGFKDLKWEDEPIKIR